MRRSRFLSLALALALAGASAPRTARAVLDTEGFRAVAVAQTPYPISAMAVAPDGRLFAAVQELGQTTDPTPGTAEIRVFSSYKTTDGSTLDTGAVWATVEGVRATTMEEGLLGIALAPDFASSKLVYVYLTTTDEDVNQHIRVYRENANGTGDFVGTAKTTLEPPNQSSNRNGGHLAFGVDGCLMAGIGDNSGGGRWNAQLMSGTNPISGTENTNFCTNVCLGTTEYPDRTIQDDDGLPNFAGKVLRMSVAGGAAQPAPGQPFAEAPYVFGAGFRNPAGLTVHPLTGQLYVADRSDTLQAEIDLVAPGANGGWPCLEGGDISSGGVAGCLAGHTKDEVYANHPSWSHPIVTHTGNPQVTGLAVSTSLGYPDEFYGDVFYLLRDSARIYRIDLQAPCFMPTGTELEPLAFHDSTSDNDFRAVYDIDDDDDFDNVGLTVLSAITQGPSPTGNAALYVVGKQGNGFTDDSVIFRIEYASTFTPYGGPAGRVPDSCFAGIENPFARAACFVPSGVCAGQADGTSCDDGDTCNGTDACQGGVCAHSGNAADGTSCAGTDGCRTGGSCQSGACVGGVASPDGTPCPDADPCNGTESCQAGACTSSGGPALFDVKSVAVRGGNLALSGNVAPSGPIAPSSTDAVVVTLDAGGTPQFTSTLAHPASDPLWAKSKPPAVFKYKDGGGGAGGLTMFQLKRRGSSYALKVKGRGAALQPGALGARLVVGGQCYAASLTCSKKGKAVRCVP